MHALAKLCVRRPVFATMLILALVVTGIFSYFSLGVDLFPKVDVPTVQVIISNPGASPEEIESEISKKVEDAINTISEVDEVHSTSSEGQSLVVATFLLSKNGDVAAQEVQNHVNLIVPDLPQTAKQPVIQKFDPDAAPVLRIAVWAPRSMRDLTLIADKQIKQKLETAKGVGEITIVGGAKREIHIMVDPDRLRAYNLTITDVFNALHNQNLELPGGSLNAGANEFTVRTTGRVPEVPDFDEIAVANRGGYTVKVKDIGHAEDSYQEPRTASRLDGVPAVTLVVAKQSGENTVATADEVRARLKDIKATLPKDINAEIVSDQSIFIKAAVDNIKHHLVLGSLFAAVVIFIFLANIRTTLIAAIAIPTSLISTFALMAAMGFTLNQITMLALTLMVGIVIDDAIIVLENVYRFIEEKNMPPMEAAIAGTKEIGLAVMATTLSLLAVFLPVGFMGGIVGRFMSSFGFTAGFAIAISLLVSFTVTPMLCSRFLRKPKQSAHSSKDAGFFHFLDSHYTVMLRWAMAHRKIMVALCGLVILSIVPLFSMVGKNFLPADDQSQFNVLVRAPEGASLAATANVAERIAQDVRSLPGVQHTLMTAGAGADVSVNSASIFVSLTDIDRRKATQLEIMQKTRDLMKKYPKDIHTGVELVSTVGGSQSNADVQYFIQGPDLDKLTLYSDTLLAKMKSIPHIADVDSTLRGGKPEVRLVIDRARAADLGVSVSDIEQALNTLVAGQVASTFKAGEDQYDVRVRSQEQFRNSPEALARVTVPSPRLGSVGLDQVVKEVEGTGPSAINRINRQRQVTVTANVLPGGSQTEVLRQLNEASAQMGMEPGYQSGLSGASKELARTGYYFVLAFLLTFIFMYIVLAAQFESFIHPITILLTLPLAVPFGIVALLIAGQTVNIFSGLGLLLLFGIVKKNAILQIDHTNGLRAAGMPRFDAIIQANRDRLRPILMTTMALVAGMLPLVVSHGTGAATNRSIGVLVVGGQTLCLLLTLLAVPVFYSLWEDLGDFAVRVSARVSGRLRRGAAVATALIGSLVGSAFGQTLSIGVPALQEAAVPARVGIVGQKNLTLREAIERTLANDPDLRIQRTLNEESAQSVRAAQGYYDPTLGLKAFHTKSVVPEASVLGGAPDGKLTQTEWNAAPTISGQSPWLGSSYTFGLTNSRQSTDSQFATLNPQFSTLASIGLTQPLVRGLRFDQGRYQLAVARKNEALSKEQLRQHVMEVVTQAITAYWELDFAYQNLEVQTEAVRLAELQFQSNRRQAEQGVLAPVDVVAAQTQVATFQQSVFQAQQALTQAENNLKSMMLPNRVDELWNFALTPDTLEPGDLTAPALDAAVKQALAGRPELSETALQVAINQLDRRLSTENTRPRVDLFANLSASGLAGTVVPQTSNPLAAFFPSGFGAVPPIFLGGYGQSLHTLSTGAFPTVQVGVNISLPLRNRTASAQAAISALEGKRLATLKDQVAMAIEADVRNAMQMVVSARARRQAAVLARQSAEQQYESEQRQFQAGTSTTFLVLQRQTDLITARSRETRASSDMAEAGANLDRAVAGVLETNQIVVN
jgi:hydrophobic/amphiphilic exporter-1 (mainly G- bacteria), HAE1 family